MGILEICYLTSNLGPCASKLMKAYVFINVAAGSGRPFIGCTPHAFKGAEVLQCEGSKWAAPAVSEILLALVQADRFGNFALIP